MINRIFHRVRSAHPNHRRIAIGMLSVAVFVLAAKLIAMAKEMAVAGRFGISGEVDAYLLSVTLVTWLPMILFSVGSMVLVPRFVALANEPSERADLVAELNGTMLTLGILTTALAIVLGPELINLIAKSWDAATQQLAHTFVWQLAPIALLNVIIAFLSIRLQAEEKQGYTLLEAMPALSILILVLLISPEVGPVILVWGTLVGVSLQTILLLQMTGRVHGPVGGIAFSHRSPYWKSIHTSFGIMLIGQLVIGLAVPIDQVFGAQLGEGTIATLGYANRLIALALGLGATAIGRALLPVLSEAAAKREFDLGRIQAFKWAGLMFCAGVMMVVVGWLFAPAIVSLLFEHGAFTAKDTVIVAQVFRFGLIQLPFYFSGIVLVQWIAARNQLGFLTLLAFANIITKTSTAILLIPILGIQGIQLSTAAMYFVSMCGCGYIVKRIT